MEQKSDQMIIEKIRKLSEGGFPLSIVPTQMVCDVPLHTHDYYEIVIFQQGSAVHQLRTLDGIESFSTVMQGDCFVILPGECHAFMCGKNASYKNLIVSHSFLKKESEQLSQLAAWHTFFEQRRADLSKVRLAPYERSYLNEWLKQLNRELNLRLPGYQICAKLYLLNILVTILRKDPLKSVPHVNGIAEQGLLAVLNEMERAPESNYPLDYLSHKAGMSVSGFTRSFRLMTGCSSREYLSMLRVQKAAGLLLETVKGLKEISYECGFCDQNYLIKSFRKRYGVTPNDFRKNTPNLHTVL
ncbi:MAG: helix-turn-helix domain-containing protein [Victivallales bacterium]|nr:helix-turn-helix domain-containing protein [Victivallales bacterium]